MPRLYRDSRTFFGVEDDIWTALAIWTIIGLRGINSNVNSILYFVLNKQVSWDTVIVGGISLILLILGVAASIKKMGRREFLLIGAIVLLWFLSFLLNEDARRILKGTYFSTVIIYGSCGIMCIANFKDWEKFAKVGFPVTLIGLISFFTLAGLSISGEAVTGYMNFSYDNIIFVISSFWLAIHWKKAFMWIPGVIGIIILIFTGCRGALMCVLTYILLEFILSKKIHIAAKIAFFAFVAFLFFNLEFLMLQFDSYVKQFGYESRTIEKFFEGTLQDVSGRDNVFKYAWELALERPVMGYGMGGSSIPLFERINEFTATSGQGAYSHNLFIELILHFGFFLGGFIGVWIVLQTVRTYLKERNRNNYNILFFFFSLIIPKLMVSSVYLAEPDFFVFLGLLLNLCSVYDNKEENIRYKANNIF